jgi:hypothetical protein
LVVVRTPKAPEALDSIIPTSGTQIIGPRLMKDKEALSYIILASRVPIEVLDLTVIL